MRKVIDPYGTSTLFAPAIAHGAFIYVSGQGGLSNDAVVGGGIQAETTQALTNIDLLLKASGSGIEDAVAITCYLADIREWDQMNEAWSTFFKGRPVPTRTAIGVAALPRGMRVEMTAVAARGGQSASE
jgi:2-iminobutanoate/2-iminopropanoate deaminase